MGLRFHSYIFVSIILIFDLSFLTYDLECSENNYKHFSKSPYEAMPKNLLKINHTHNNFHINVILHKNIFAWKVIIDFLNCINSFDLKYIKDMIYVHFHNNMLQW